jgi:transcriptional regulator with XRE-family HTH domain
LKKGIHEKISDFRKSKGLTQEQLGAMLNISGQAVSKWEKGESMPDIMILPDLCRIFGITIDTLLDMPHSVTKENIIKDVVALSEYNGKEQTLYEIMAAVLSGSENKTTGNIIMCSDSALSLFDDRGMGFLISNSEYMQKCLDYDTENVSATLKFLSDEQTLNILRCIDPCKAITKDELEQQTGYDSSIINGILLEMMENRYICKEYDSDGKLGYMPAEKIFIVYMILSGIIFPRRKGYTKSSFYFKIDGNTGPGVTEQQKKISDRNEVK